MSRKNIGPLAEKCVREQLPIVEFTQWYEQEGQYINEGWGNVLGGAGLGAAAGAGLGSFIPGVGNIAGGLAGAGVGALAGGAKTLWDRYAQKRVGSGGDSRAASDTKQLSPKAQAQPNIDPNSAINQQRNMLKLQAQYKSARQADPLFQDLGTDIANNLASNGIDPKTFSDAVAKNAAGGASQEQAVEKTLQQLGIRKALFSANPYYAWNAKTSAYEWTTDDATKAMNRLVAISPNINLEEVIKFIKQDCVPQSMLLHL